MAAVTAPVGVAETSSLHRIFKIQTQSQCSYWESLSPTLREACINPDVSRTIGDNTAFDPAGEIQKKWNNEVYPAVKDLLTDQLVWIYKYEKARVPYCFTLYMIGNASCSARPTVVTTCIRMKLAERITKLLRAKLARYRLGFNYLANSTHLTRPAGTSTFQPREKLSAAYLRYHGDAQEGGEGEADQVSCGLQIFACNHAGNVLSSSTAGGCLWVDNICHFMTVSHVMLEDLPWGEDGLPHISTNMCENWSDVSSISSDDGDCATDSGGTSGPVCDPMLLSDREYILRIRQIHSLQTSHILSHPFDWDMDWAMFTSDLDNELSTTFNRLTLPNGSKAVVQDIDIHGPQGKALLVTNGKAEEVGASSTKVGIFLPNSAGVIDGWPIEYKSSPGQCGSWVLSPDAKLYGTLAMYAESYGQSYIFPITQTLNSMRTMNPGREIQLLPAQKIHMPEHKTRDSTNESTGLLSQPNGSHGRAPLGQQPAVSDSTSAAAIVPRPFRTRDSDYLACLRCRARHSRCDGEPECSSCKLAKRPCVYIASRDILTQMPELQDGPLIEDDGSKPNRTYTDLIGMAILGSPNRQLTITQICKWISDTFSFYQTTHGSGWQNSIRHNLSLNKIFQKKKRPKDDPDKGDYWVIQPGMERQFVQERSRSNKSLGIGSSKEVIAEDPIRSFQGSLKPITAPPALSKEASRKKSSVHSADKLSFQTLTDDLLDSYSLPGLPNSARAVVLGDPCGNKRRRLDNAGLDFSLNPSGSESNAPSLDRTTPDSEYITWVKPKTSAGLDFPLYPTGSESDVHSPAQTTMDSGYVTWVNGETDAIYSDATEGSQDLRSSARNIQLDDTVRITYDADRIPRLIRDLDDHLPNEIIYRCNHPGCSFTCRRPSDWKIHINRHTRPYKCDLAGCKNTKGFANINDLERHRVTVHKLAPRKGSVKGSDKGTEPRLKKIADEMEAAEGPAASDHQMQEGAP